MSLKLDFHAPIIADKKAFDEILQNNEEFSSEYAFGTSYIWEKAYNVEICILDNTIFKKYTREGVAFSFPYGQGDTRKALNNVVSYAESIGTKLKFIGMTENRVNELERLMPGKFKFESNRDTWDYVYRQDELAELKGRKFHSKRNHISKFNKLYEWEYEAVTHENTDKCREVSDKWFEVNKDSDLDEYDALERAYRNYKDLGLDGGLLKVDSKPVAFTIGERINEDVYVVHFEKAFDDIEGAYTVINNEFCKRLSGYKYINREEDLGIVGLRKAKMSYKPAMMVKKYTAVMEGEG